MASTNPFDLLGDDAEDPSQQIAAEQLKVVAAAPKKSPNPQLPTKPLPPAQAVREARNETSRGGRGGGNGRGYGRGRGASGFNRDSSNDWNSFAAPAGQGAPEGESGKPSERNEYGGSRGPYRGGRGGRGDSSIGEVGENGRPRRAFERRSGTGRGNEFKREGAGKGNWGGQTEEIVQVTEDVTVKNLGDEKPSGEDDVVADGIKESSANEAEEKEPEDKEMTLEEYEKVLEEKRKALQALKTDERKVDTKVFESMQQLSSKKDNDDIFIKLNSLNFSSFKGSDKDKRREALEKEEKSKKAVSINEFLKPAGGENYYNPGGRGRGRGRGARGGYGGGYSTSNVPAPSIEDPGHFPTLGAK